MNLLGREVLESNGSLVGIVKNITFDEKNWQVQSFNVQLNEDTAKEFEVNKLIGSYAMAIDVTKVQAVGEKISLKLSKQDLKAVIVSSETVAPA